MEYKFSLDGKIGTGDISFHDVGRCGRGYQNTVEKCGSKGLQHSFCKGWSLWISAVTMRVDVDRGYQHSLFGWMGKRGYQHSL